jgi:hypothetical protein
VSAPTPHFLTPDRLNAQPAISFRGRRQAPNSGHGRDIFAAVQPGWRLWLTGRVPEWQHLLVRAFGMRLDEGAGSVGQVLLFALSKTAHFSSYEL